MADTPALSRFTAARSSAVVVRLRWLAVRWQVALVLIVLLGAGLRLHGLTWDEPAGANAPLQMHPDERFLSLVSDRIDWPKSLGGYFDTARSPLNPYNDGETHSYVYGTFPLFLVKGIATFAGDDPPGPGNSYDKDITWGRAITAVVDALTIVLVFYLGWQLFSRNAGLLAALLYALSVLPTQLAHFWTMDPYVVFFGAATLLVSSVAIPRGRRDLSPRKLALLFATMGLCVGLGLASKVTAWPLALAPIVVVVIRMGLRDFPRLGLRWRGVRAAVTGHWAIDIGALLLSGVVALIVFRIAQPYAFAGPHFWDLALNPQWRADIQQQIQFQNGDVAYPPFIQFAGLTPFLGPLKDMVLFGLGPGIGIASWVAVVAAGVLLFRRREMTFLIPLVFVIAIFAFQGGRFVAFLRYFAPMYPVLCLFAGWGLLALWGWTREADSSERSKSRRSGRWTAPIARFATPHVLQWGAGLAIAAVIGYSLWWALAFQHIYSQTNTRIAASEWMYDNIPAGSTVTGEYWDDTLPYALPGKQYDAYPLIETKPYDPDTPQKVHDLIYGSVDDKGKGGLVNADYVILSSNRVRASVSRLAAMYPSTILYYKALDSGALGFKLVAEFTSRPTFLGISLDDSDAQESFTVYDHPTVRIYQKTSAFNAAKAEALLDSAQPERATQLLPKQGRTNGLQFTPAQAQTQQRGGTFADVFAAHGWTSHLPWLWWLAWLELAAFAAIPWVTWLLRVLPDRGYGLSKLLGLVAVVFPTWLLVAWGGPHFSMPLTWAVYGTVLAIGVAIGYRRRHSLHMELQDHWKTWLAIEGAFLAAFGIFLLLRYFNPDLWYDPQGGEKPMEIAYLTAITRSSIMPPYDPWFAGGTMNYYYMGWFFLAAPIRALKILPEIAFNLGIPTFAALDAAVAFSLLFNLVVLSSRSRIRRVLKRREWRRPALFAGLLGVILLIGIGNLDSLVQNIERFQAVSHWHLLGGVPVIGGAIELVGGFGRWVAGTSLPPFDWWRPSRVHFGTIDITEFPYWSLLFSDLHPHLMDVPFFGTVISLAAAYAFTVRARLKAQGWLLAVLLGIAVGLVHAIQTWDYPTALIIAFGGIVFGQLMRHGRWQDRWWETAGHGVVAALFVIVPFSPFTRHLETFDTGIKRAPQTTNALQYFDQFGIFIAFLVVFLAVRYFEELRNRNREHGRNIVLAAVNGWPELVALAVFTAGLTAFTWRWGLTTIALSALIEIFIFNLLWLEWRNPERHLARTLATAMFALAVGIGAGVDIVTVKGDLERMNTVFKFSLQAWQLYAFGSAFAAWYVGRALWRVEGWRAEPRQGRGHHIAAWTTIPVLIGSLLAGGIFLISGTAARQNARFDNAGPTLNGLAFLPDATFVEDRGTPNVSDDVTIHLEDDWPLIQWLRTNVQGSPVIVEAVGPLYHWTGRISEYTGLPAVIGWDWHQTQQREDYAGLVDQRRSDTANFYTTTNVAFANQYLLEYNVSYVIVGTEEHVFGTKEGLAKFDTMPALKAVFRDGDYAIYHVDQSKLPPPASELVEAPGN